MKRCRCHVGENEPVATGTRSSHLALQLASRARLERGHRWIGQPGGQTGAGWATALGQSPTEIAQGERLGEALAANGFERTPLHVLVGDDLEKCSSSACRNMAENQRLAQGPDPGVI